MNKYYVFHKTVQGYLHTMKDKPCEDSSASYTAPEQQYHIAIAADGHGSDSCFRSRIGSAIAAEVTLEALKEFGDYYIVRDENGHYTESDELLGLLESERSKKQLIRQLTNSIVSRWYQQVLDELAEHPLTEEELAYAEPDYAALYSRGIRLHHIYGTTLIAAFMTEHILLLIQQGDGRCDVFYDDGTVDQPIPWDDRCFDVYTTSMCDDDVDTSIRSVLIDLKEKQVAACFMGSDGVEDSYRTMEGTHAFYRELTMRLLEQPDAFPAYLDVFLPRFSKAGSGDDVSVSGIVNVGIAEKLRSIYRSRVDAYHLAEERIQIQSKIDSMSRKHQNLQLRVKKATEYLTAATEAWFNASMCTDKSLLEAERQNRPADAITADMEYAGLYHPVEVPADTFGLVDLIRSEFPSAFTVVSETLKKDSSDAKPSSLSILEKAKMALQFQKPKVDELSDKLYHASQEYSVLHAEYEEYNQKYLLLCEELSVIDAKIRTLELL